MGSTGAPRGNVQFPRTSFPLQDGVQLPLNGTAGAIPPNASPPPREGTCRRKALDISNAPIELRVPLLTYPNCNGGSTRTANLPSLFF